MNSIQKQRQIEYSADTSLRKIYQIIYLLVSLEWIGGEAIIFGFENLPQSSFKPIIAETSRVFMLTVFLYSFRHIVLFCVFKGRHRRSFTVNQCNWSKLQKIVWFITVFTVLAGVWIYFTTNQTFYGHFRLAVFQKNSWEKAHQILKQD